MTGAVVLAAGASRRLGRPKQLLEVDGEPLVRRAARLAGEAGCWPVVVVLGAQAEPCRKALEGLGVVMVENAEWGEGMSSSVRCGVAALRDEVDAVLLMTVDQVRVAPEDLKALMEAQRGAVASAAEYSGRLGVPAVLGRPLWGELTALAGDVGARGVLERHRAEVARVEMPWAAVDLDTEGDWQAILGAGR